MTKFLLLHLLLLSQLSFSQSPDIAKALTGKLVCFVAEPAKDSLPRIRMRCGGKVQTNHQPLYIVDGEVSEGDLLRTLNPNDIETITVLKNAVAAALYGSRAANGVIVVSTKATRRINLIDETDSLPVSGATVQLNVGAKRHVYASDKDGILSIPTKILRAADELSVSAIGYQTISRKVAGNSEAMLLKRKIQTLEPVNIVSNSRLISCRLFCGGRVIRTYNLPLTKKPEEKQKVLLYPNPATRAGRVKVSLPSPSQCFVLYAVVAVSGQVLLQANVPSALDKTFSFQTGNWPAGTYLLTIFNKEGQPSVREKFILQ